MVGGWVSGGVGVLYKHKHNPALIIVYYDFLCRVDPTYIEFYAKDHQFKSSYVALRGCNYVGYTFLSLRTCLLTISVPLSHSSENPFWVE